MAKRSKALSPYQKYGKREFVYSAAYQAWARKYRPIKASQIDGNRHLTAEMRKAS